MTYKPHPAAELFPMMEPDALKELANDIKKNGLVQSITVFGGQILDGRNRLVACQMAGVRPTFADWTGTGSPTAWVLSVNLHRRHLTPSQKGLIGYGVLPLFEAEAKERQKQLATHRESEKRNGPTTEIIPELSKGEARQKAAAAVGVNPRYISDVKTIAKERPEMLDKIKTGEITIPQAKREIAESKETIWDAGSIAERPPKHDPEDDDSDGLWNLKQCWRKASKKEKTAFLNWVEESGSKSKQRK